MTIYSQPGVVYRPGVEIKLLHPDAKVPQYATPGSAAVDLCAMIEDGAILLRAGEGFAFNTGIAVSINDPNMVCVVNGRSGLRFKHCVAPLDDGIIDSDYQGEIKVHLFNSSYHDYTICHGDRIAQMMFQRVEHPNFMIVEQFSTQTERGVNGLGSTGR
jgi:dUTP pyrophosphatase